VTQIVLHPHFLPRCGPYVWLPAPWAWWETRTTTDLVVRHYPDAIDIREYTVTFGEDGERVMLTDPPAMILLHLRTYQDLWEDVPRTLLMSDSLSARVVWWQSPGERWRQVPYVPMCRPGEYRHDSFTGTSMEVQRRAAAEWGDGEIRFGADIPVLQWPMQPMIVDGQSIGPPSVQIGTAAHEAAEVYEGPLDDVSLVQQHMIRRREIAHIYDIPEEFLPANPALGRIRDRYERIQTTWRAMQDQVGAAEVRVPQETYRSGWREPIGDRITFDELRARRARYGPAVLPERDVVDEIDRLVNEELRPGPVDDYETNRYPKCKHCGCDWHGLLCAHCACLGELEDPV